MSEQIEEIEEVATVQKEWTEQERLELAAKLDAELDDFINGLEKKRYTEGWPEDRWQEEMDKHPFFMKKAPQPGDEVHPLFEGLQKLKYDPEENTAEDLAMNYKEDGNFYMKHKKFRMAVYSFSEGLKVKCPKAEVQAILYNNRSAAQFFLKNYRWVLVVICSGSCKYFIYFEDRLCLMPKRLWNTSRTMPRLAGEPVNVHFIFRSSNNARSCVNKCWKMNRIMQRSGSCWPKTRH